MTSLQQPGDIFVSQLTQEYPTDTLLGQLVVACATGQLSTVEGAIQKWLSMPNPAPERPSQDTFHYMQPALRVAAYYHQIPTISLLLKKGFRITKAVVESAISSDPTTADNGWDINDRWNNHLLPSLAKAVAKNDLGLVQWFLSRNADPNISNSYSGQTALTGAVSHASLGILKLLVQHGGDVRRGDLLHAALSSTLPGKREKLDYLLDHGAPVDALQHSASPRLFGHMGPKGLGTALHLAAAQDDAAMATALLGRGADRDVKDTLGRTPLDLAKKYGFQRVMAVLEEA